MAFWKGEGRSMSLHTTAAKASGDKTLLGSQLKASRNTKALILRSIKMRTGPDKSWGGGARVKVRVRVRLKVRVRDSVSVVRVRLGSELRLGFGLELGLGLGFRLRLRLG